MYRKLRGKLREMGIDQKYLAGFFGISQASVSHRFTGSVPWTIPEAYTIMNLIQEPCERLHEFFPRDGGVTRARKETT